MHIRIYVYIITFSEPTSNSVTVSSAYDPLKGHVWTGTEEDKAGPDIQFLSPRVAMKGVYTCSVYHHRTDLQQNPVSQQYNLYMFGECGFGSNSKEYICYTKKGFSSFISEYRNCVAIFCNF